MLPTRPSALVPYYGANPVAASCIIHQSRLLPKLLSLLRVEPCAKSAWPPTRFHPTSLNADAAPSAGPRISPRFPGLAGRAGDPVHQGKVLLQYLRHLGLMKFWFMGLLCSLETPRFRIIRLSAYGILDFVILDCGFLIYGSPAFLGDCKISDQGILGLWNFGLWDFG